MNKKLETEVYLSSLSVPFSKSDKVTLAKLIVPVFLLGLFTGYLCDVSPPTHCIFSP